MHKVGMLFSREFEGNNPLGHIGVKLPVYLRLLDLIEKEGWEAFILTKKTYQGEGIFNGVWKYQGGKFERLEAPIKIDLVFDRSAGVKFPLKGDESAIWVNKLDFKTVCWDKDLGYKEVGEYMPSTFLVNSEEEISEVAKKIKTDWMVLKPFNGLKGMGLFIGSKEDALSFKFDEKYKKYIAQDFVDTSNGITGITPGLHDLRLAIVNGEVVWSHVRVPQAGSFKSNAAAGGVLTEVDLKLIPSEVKKIADLISKKFYDKYDNPIYSLDFGINIDGTPYIFEINDQIGFPAWGMENRDNFLNALIKNFKGKLSK
jgi:hypothetical protein